MSFPKDYSEFNNLAWPIVTLIIAAYLLFGLVRPLRRIVGELKFYRSNNWGMWLDCGNECWVQDQFVRLFPLWPIGVIKFSVEFFLVISKLDVIALLLIVTRN